MLVIGQGYTKARNSIEAYFDRTHQQIPPSLCWIHLTEFYEYLLQP